MNMRTTFYLMQCIFLLGLNHCLCDVRPRSIFTPLLRKTLSEDGQLNFTQLATKYGHNAEQHDVVTEDGYVLTVFHLAGEKPPVLLFHGLIDSSDTFIIRGKISLAITLADAGYDVWVGNCRGNRYGRRHVTLDPDKDDTFWDFSLQEIGYYDLAATIDFIRSKTNSDNITTFGHSQGTAAHYVLASTRPEYNSRIKITISLAPIAFLDHLQPPNLLLALAGPAILAFLRTLHIIELVQDQSAASDLIKLVCSKRIVSYAVCALGAVFPIAGFDPTNLEPGFLSTAFGHFPAGTSLKNVVHYDQIILRGRFGQFDYGVTKNLAKYASATPPDYDLSKVTMNVALLVGNNDQLSRVKDVEHLRDSLPNVVYYELLEPKLMSHLDFVWGLHMPRYLYPSIFKILERYN